MTSQIEYIKTHRLQISLKILNTKYTQVLTSETISRLMNMKFKNIGPEYFKSSEFGLLRPTSTQKKKSRNILFSLCNIKSLQTIAISPDPTVHEIKSLKSQSSRPHYNSSAILSLQTNFNTKSKHSTLSHKMAAIDIQISRNLNENKMAQMEHHNGTQNVFLSGLDLAGLDYSQKRRKQNGVDGTTMGTKWNITTTAHKNSVSVLHVPS